MRLSNLIRRNKRQQRTRDRHFFRRSLMEQLEPRLLLTTDLPGDELSSSQYVDVTSGQAQTFNEQIGDGSYGDLDVDVYEVSLAAGQTLTADVDAYLLDDGSNLSSLDSYLRLFDEYGTEWAYNDYAASSDDYTGDNYYDAYLSFVASVTGTYYLAVSGEYNTYYDPTAAGSGGSGSTGAYQLTLLADVPDAPGDQLSSAQTVNLTPGVTQTLTEEVGNGLYGDLDVDLFAVSLTTGQTLTADIDAYYLDDERMLWWWPLARSARLPLPPQQRWVCSRPPESWPV